MIIEWVPREDAMAQALLRDRPDIFEDYTQIGFESAAEQHFAIRRKDPIAGSLRFLYVLDKR